MRLIDADRLSQNIKSRKYIDKALSAIFETIIDDQPTIGDGDITPEMARVAYNVLRRNCAQHKDCSECGIKIKGGCPGFSGEPLEDWPDLEAPDEIKNHGIYR